MYRLLIADDEVIERAYLYKTLNKNLGDQCAIFQAENGREALRIYEEEKIQIVIMDIEMPGINGIEAAERIREQDPDCCIIFLTAFDEFSYAKKAITIKALDYLLKPYDEKELMLVLEEAMHLTDKRLMETASAERIKTDHHLKNVSLYHEGDEDLRITKVTEIISRYIQDNYKYDISMQDLARTMNYSEPYFCKLFKQYFNQNFTSYLTEYRVNEAKKMLEQPTVNVKDIGRAVGYSDSNYFTKVFKRITGLSPTEYRLSIFQ
jgi:YesN/AraC family two-component response regulator